VSETRIKVRERHIEYRYLEGDRARPVLVLLHEGLGCVALWRDFPEALVEATGCGVFAYSRFGYGGSDSEPLPWPLDYMQREGLYGLPAVLDAAGIGDHILVGHSDGASIALVNAGAVRDPRLKAVVVMAPHVFAEDCGIASIHSVREEFLFGELPNKLAKYHDDAEGAFRGWSDSWLHPAFKMWNIEHYLLDIRVPLLQVQGEDDQFGTDLQLESIARNVPGGVETRVLPECRHAPQFDQRVAVVAFIEAFTSACI
jgi:pimeloyl-ACP methyl ester carboxylesterase